MSGVIGSAALLAAMPAVRAARPHYGGTLVVQSDGVIRSLDPASADVGETARARILPLVFETLVAVDSSGGLRPELATTWEHDARGARWRFTIRAGVVLHDRSMLDGGRVASALSARERAWKVTGDGNAVIIETDRPRPDLPWILSDAGHAIAVGTASGSFVGSGPFALDRIDETRIVLRAHGDYWGGRPFLDTVQIEQKRPLRDQLAALESGQSDMVSLAPTDVRRVADRGLRTSASRPLTLYALVFEAHRAQSADDGLRAALAASIDPSTLATVLLQRQAEPAAGFLPAWISGYGPLLHDVAAAPSSRRVGSPARRPLMLRIDAADSVARALADRIAVDARERGLDVTVQAPGSGLAPRPDVRLVRLRVEPTSPDRALASIAQGIGARTIALITQEPAPSADASLAAVFHYERTLLRYNILIPVVHVEDVYGIGDRVESWNEPLVSPTGAWRLATAWLRSDRPSG